MDDLVRRLRFDLPTTGASEDAADVIEQLESDLATAEQDSRQKQARIERLELAVKDLRTALEACVSDAERVNHVMLSEAGIGMVDMVTLTKAQDALKSTEDA